MLFKLTNKQTKRETHCGVLEFVADEGRIYIPYWVSSFSHSVRGKNGHSVWHQFFFTKCESEESTVLIWSVLFIKCESEESAFFIGSVLFHKM